MKIKYEETWKISKYTSEIVMLTTSTSNKMLKEIFYQKYLENVSVMHNH